VPPNPAALAAVICRAILMNVNEPETRGVALALHVVLDDLGKARRRLRNTALFTPVPSDDSDPVSSPSHRVSVS